VPQQESSDAAAQAPVPAKQLVSTCQAIGVAELGLAKVGVHLFAANVCDKCSLGSRICGAPNCTDIVFLAVSNNNAFFQLTREGIHATPKVRLYIINERMNISPYIHYTESQRLQFVQFTVEDCFL